MPLVHLLFRCPICGQTPLEGADDRAACPRCGADFRRGGPGARIRVSEPAKNPREVPAWELGRAVQEWADQAEASAAAGGGSRHQARVTARRLASEEPVVFRGSLLGFAERSTPEETGILTLAGDLLAYRADGASATEEWPLLEIRAVQTSSRSVQVRLSGGDLVQFGFPEDSPKRWDELLRARIARLWRETGRGEVTEFQPRITTR